MDGQAHVSPEEKLQAAIDRNVARQGRAAQRSAVAAPEVAHDDAAVSSSNRQVSAAERGGRDANERLMGFSAAMVRGSTDDHGLAEQEPCVIPTDSRVDRASSRTLCAKFLSAPNQRFVVRRGRQGHRFSARSACDKKVEFVDRVAAYRHLCAAGLLSPE
jgi:hypothetical protein